MEAVTNKTLKELAEAATQGEWFVHEPYTHAIFTNDFHIANAFEERDLAYIVAAHPIAILALLDQHAAEIAAKDARIKELEAQVYAPGLWRCAKCDFKLIQSNLNARDGSVTAREMPGDICPNCRVPLWRITERQRHHTLMSDNERLFYEKRLAESSLAEANARIKELEGWVANGDAAYNDAADRGARNMLALAKANARIKELEAAREWDSLIGNAREMIFDKIVGIDCRLIGKAHEIADAIANDLRRAALAGTDTPEKTGA